MADTHEITVTHKITEENLKDLVATAFEGGSNYWIGEVRLCAWEQRGPNNYVSHWGQTAEHISDIPALGGVLQIREYGDPCLWHNLTSNGLLRGITRAANEGRINPGTEDWMADVDAEVADVILQYALLNEIRYG